MVIRTENQLDKSECVSFKGVTKKLIIGPSVNSNEIVLRIMQLDAGCANIYHSHPFPHIWKIEKGSGIYIDGNKNEAKIKTGDFIFVDQDEPHCLKNNTDEPLVWLCFGTIDSEKMNPLTFTPHEF